VSKRRFIEPGTTRLDLSEGDWIEVKNELDYGEQLQLKIAATEPMAAGPNMPAENLTIKVNPFLWSQKQLELYLTDWSFRDAQDRPVPINRTTLLSLDPETVDEMEAAINAHEAAVKSAKNGHGASR
jgi:hypothetical protein